MDVSVAIPCYNGAPYIGNAIQAILDQTHPASQVLIIDDGSTDRSAEIIGQYPVELIQHATNRGLAAARNTALEAATGDIIVFVDADAYADPKLVASLLNGYTSPHVGGVGGQGIEARVQSRADRWRRAHASQSHGQQAKTVSYLYGLCMSFRQSALEAVNGFDTAFRTNAEDIDGGLRLNAAGFTLRYEPKARVYHQRTDDQASLTRTMANWYAGAYRAKMANRAQPWRLYAGTLRRLVADPFKDIFVFRDPALVPLSLAIGFAKMKALLQARKATGGRR